MLQTSSGEKVMPNRFTSEIVNGGPWGNQWYHVDAEITNRCGCVRRARLGAIPAPGFTPEEALASQMAADAEKDCPVCEEENRENWGE